MVYVYVYLHVEVGVDEWVSMSIYSICISTKTIKSIMFDKIKLARNKGSYFISIVYFLKNKLFCILSRILVTVAIKTVLLYDIYSKRSVSGNHMSKLIERCTLWGENPCSSENDSQNMYDSSLPSLTYSCQSGSVSLMPAHVTVVTYHLVIS